MSTAESLQSASVSSSQEFTFRTRNYKPLLEVNQFIGFLAKEYYPKEASEVLNKIRQAIGEFSNDPNLTLMLNCWTDNRDEEYGPALTEQYVGKVAEDGDPIFSVMITSDSREGSTLPNAWSKPSLPLTVKSNDRRVYRTNKGAVGIPFVSVYYQFQILMAALGTHFTSTWVVSDVDESKLFVQLRPRSRQLKYQVLFRISLPTLVPSIAAK